MKLESSPIQLQSFLIESGEWRVVEWLSSWLAEKEVQGLIPRLATWISEIDYLLLPGRNMAEKPLKRHKSSIQPTN